MYWLQRLLKFLSKWIRSRAIRVEGLYYYILSEFQRVSLSLQAVREKGTSFGGLGGRAAVSLLNLLNPIFLLSTSWALFFRWGVSRDPKVLLGSVPALVVVISGSYLLAWRAPRIAPTADLLGAQITSAVASGNPERAKFFARLWSQRSPENAGQSVRTLAQALTQSGELDQAIEQLELSLRQYPEDYLTMENLSNLLFLSYMRAPASNGEMLSRLTAMLTKVTTELPGVARSKLNLAKVLALRLRFAEAYRLTVELSQFRALSTQMEKQERLFWADVWLTRAICVGTDVRQMSSEQLSERRQSAVRAWEAYTTVNTVVFETWCIAAVNAAILAEKEREGVRFVGGFLNELMQSRQIEEQDPEALSQMMQLRNLMAQMYVAECRRLRTSGDTRNLLVVLDSLRRAVELNPRYTPVVEELSMLCLERDLDSESLESTMQFALDNGIAPGVVHFLRGTKAATADPPDSALARQEFELAMSQQISAVGLLNNLANLIADDASADSDQIKRAFSLLESALNLYPDLPAFLDTRGKLKLRQGNALEAVADFELALRDVRIQAEVHGNIARAYELLGDQGKVDYHRQLSQKIRAEAEASE